MRYAVAFTKLSDESATSWEGDADTPEEAEALATAHHSSEPTEEAPAGGFLHGLTKDTDYTVDVSAMGRPDEA